MTGQPAPVVITGTGTDVGKTIATAALAALGRSAGLDVGICKPIQTGLQPGQPGDADDAVRLAGVHRMLEVRRLPDPLAPETAARLADQPQSTLEDLAGPIRDWLDSHKLGVDVAVAGTAINGAPSDGAPTPRLARLNLIEGAGGVLVRLGTNLTVLDLAAEFEAPVVVVARAGLGTLSDTELAVRAIQSAGLLCAGIIIGSWPDGPTLAERCNLDDLPRLTGAPVLGLIPEGSGSHAPAEFARRAPGWFESGALDTFCRSRLTT